MTWITDNKGAGPWDFVPQPEKCGYVNNPRWTANRASDIDHEPCGYWPKGTSTVTDVKIYDLVYGGGPYPTLSAYTFDGTTLTLLGGGEAGYGLCEYQGDSILTLVGDGPTAQIRRVRGVPPFDTIGHYAPFNAYDMETISNRDAVYWFPELGSHLAHAKSGQVIKLSLELARQGRFYHGTVIDGTDGHRYTYKYASSDSPPWNLAERPITGGFWGTVWSVIPDDVCDSPIAAWDSETAIPISDNGNMVYANGSVYVCMTNQSSPGGSIRRLHPTTFAKQAVHYGGGSASIIVNANGVYRPDYNGTGGNVVTRYDPYTLASIADSPAAVGFTGGQVIFHKDTIIHLIGNYFSPWGLRRYDQITLALLQEQTYPNGTGQPYQLITLIDDNFLLVGSNDHVRVLDAHTLQPVTPLVSLYGGYAQEAMLVVPQGLHGTISTAHRCGTSPVWPMPA